MKRTLSQTDLSVPNFVTFTIRGIPNAAYQLGQTFSEITMQIRATVWSTDIVDDINYSVAQQVWNLQGLWLCKRVFKLMQNNRHVPFQSPVRQLISYLPLDFSPSDR